MNNSVRGWTDQDARLSHRSSAKQGQYPCAGLLGSQTRPQFLLRVVQRDRRENVSHISEKSATLSLSLTCIMLPGKMINWRKLKLKISKNVKLWMPVRLNKRRGWRKELWTGRFVMKQRRSRKRSAPLSMSKGQKGLSSRPSSRLTTSRDVSTCPDRSVTVVHVQLRAASTEGQFALPTTTRTNRDAQLK